MNVIRLEMSFKHFTFSLSGQFVKHFTKVLAQLAIQSLLRHFGIQTTWYLHSHFEWLRHCALLMKPFLRDFDRVPC